MHKFSVRKLFDLLRSYTCRCECQQEKTGKNGDRRDFKSPLRACEAFLAGELLTPCHVLWQAAKPIPAGPAAFLIHTLPQRL